MMENSIIVLKVLAIKFDADLDFPFLIQRCLAVLCINIVLTERGVQTSYTHYQTIYELTKEESWTLHNILPYCVNIKYLRLSAFLQS